MKLYNIFSFIIYLLVIMYCVIVSCEKNYPTEVKVIGVDSELSGTIDTLFTDWGTFDGYGFYWNVPEDTLDILFDIQQYEDLEMASGIKTDLYKEIRFEYTAKSYAVEVLASMHFEGTYVDNEIIKSDETKQVKYLCPEFKISGNNFGVYFRNQNTNISGYLLVYDLLVTGVRK